MSKNNFLPGSIEHGVVKVLTTRAEALSRAELGAELRALGLKRGRGLWPLGALRRLVRDGVLQETQDGMVAMYGLVEGGAG